MVVLTQKSADLIIKPPKRLIKIDWGELWRFRDLFLVLAWRDISVRYKQTALGALWAIFQPFVSMVIFTFIFNRVAKVESGDGTPYPIFLYIGLLLWQYYSGTLTKASESMVANANMIQKVYFPRLIVPASTALTGLVDLLVASLIFLGMSIYYGYHPRWEGLAILPLLLACMIFSSLGAGMFLASLNVKYRDVRHALPFVIQTLMYVTPVIYPVRMLDRYPAVQEAMLWLNPISGVISTARAGLLGHSPIDLRVLAISCFMSLVFFVGGLVYFRSTERYFADVV